MARRGGAAVSRACLLACLLLSFNGLLRSTACMCIIRQLKFERSALFPGSRFSWNRGQETRSEKREADIPDTRHNKEHGLDGSAYTLHSILHTYSIDRSIHFY
jgi:hypothetical protein